MVDTVPRSSAQRSLARTIQKYFHPYVYTDLKEMYLGIYLVLVQINK